MHVPRDEDGTTAAPSHQIHQPSLLPRELPPRLHPVDDTLQQALRVGVHLDAGTQYGEIHRVVISILRVTLRQCPLLTPLDAAVP